MHKYHKSVSLWIVKWFKSFRCEMCRLDTSSSRDLVQLNDSERFCKRWNLSAVKRKARPRALDTVFHRDAGG